MSAYAARTAVPLGRVQLVNLRHETLLTARWRLIWIAMVFAAVAALAVVRIGVFGFTGHAPARSSLAEQLLPPRGEITDRNGAPLARAFPAYALWFDPTAMGDSGTPLVNSPQKVARALKKIFPDLDEARVRRQLQSKVPGYLRRRVLPEDANKVMRLGEIALQFPQEIDRNYPEGSLASHVVGFAVEKEGGRMGMEKVLDKRLTDPDLRGEPVALSIDLRVQGAMEQELRRGMLATNAIGAAGIVLDADTGEVLAMASLPDFDPNVAGSAGPPNELNRATYVPYELGSTIKPLMIAAAIDAGVVRDLSRRWDARPVRTGRRAIRDGHNMVDSLNVPQALVKSSNTVHMRIAEKLGGERLRQTMIDLDMDKRPAIEFPARAAPLWPKGKWSRSTTMSVGYGYAMSVTLLHLANAFAAVVNGGIYRPATLRKLDPDKAVPGRRVFKESTSLRMRQLLRMISLYGTGRAANAPGYRVGGKTGSAEKSIKGIYHKEKNITTFAAAFPMDRPRYVVVVLLDEPRGTKANQGHRTAARNAAPVVGRLVPRIGPMLGVRPDNERDVDISDLQYLVEGRK
jgi:cell division protein FtsI (penicillin-binding protein 3)